MVHFTFYIAILSFRELGQLQKINIVFVFVFGHGTCLSKMAATIDNP